MKIIGLLALFTLVSCTQANKPDKLLYSMPKKQSVDSFSVMREKVFNFAPNSAELDEEDTLALNSLIKDILKNQKKYHRIEIIGHSDQTGTEDANLDISKERSLLILDTMKSSGVDKNKLRASWLAGTEPIEEGTIESSLNRRVEIRLFFDK